MHHFGLAMSYFAHRTAAERYARSRPYFHPLVIDMIRERLALAAPVGRALDVACGTGQSAVALRAIAAAVVGTDVSRPMLAAAPRAAGLRYVVAAAEALPLAEGVFDLLTVALAFHWFERERFLAEARRVLRPEGWLVIYNNGFSGTMRENADFARWNRGSTWRATRRRRATTRPSATRLPPPPASASWRASVTPMTSPSRCPSWPPT